jgi:protein required for attachment to host cells
MSSSNRTASRGDDAAVLVVVADAAHAHLYESRGAEADLAEVEALLNEESRKPERDLVSDGSGRRNHRPTQGASSAYGGTSMREHFAERFAAAIGKRLESQLDDDPERRIYIVAGPQFLGLLRQRLPQRVLRHIAGEVPKSMVREKRSRIRAALPARL